MTKELWIERAKEIIQNNQEEISEINFMVKSDWMKNRDYRDFLVEENKFLEEGIKLVSECS